MDVLIAEQVSLVSEIMAVALRDEDDMGNVVAVTDVQSVLNQLASQPFDIILLHGSLADDNGIALIRTVRTQHPDVKIVISGVQRADAAVMRYLELGVSGYLRSDISFNQLLSTLRATYLNEALIEPKMAALLIERLADLTHRLADRGSGQDAFYSLTPREQEILSLIAQELSNREIAEQLTVEVGTIKNHVHRILKKLGAANRQEAKSFFDILRHSPQTEKSPPSPPSPPNGQESSLLKFLPAAGPQDGVPASTIRERIDG